MNSTQLINNHKVNDKSRSRNLIPFHWKIFWLIQSNIHKQFLKSLTNLLSKFKAASWIWVPTPSPESHSSSFSSQFTVAWFYQPFWGSFFNEQLASYFHMSIFKDTTESFQWHKHVLSDTNRYKLEEFLTISNENFGQFWPSPTKTICSFLTEDKIKLESSDN